MFHNRISAGEKLAQQLVHYQNQRHTFVAGLPRGGVVTAKAVADQLNLPFFALVVKKISHPWQAELAIGAVGPDKTVIYNEIAQSLSKKEVDEQTSIAYIKQQEYEGRFGQRVESLNNATVILVDDGIATGATVETAIAYLRGQKVEKIILAVPVAAYDTMERLKKSVDEAVVLEQPISFHAVGQFYEEFEEVTDSEVENLLNSKSN